MRTSTDSLGAEIRPVASQKEREPTMAEVAAEIEAGGGHAVVIPLGASKPLGSLGYVRAANEIDVQFRDHPPPRGHLDLRLGVFVRHIRWISVGLYAPGANGCEVGRRES